MTILSNFFFDISFNDRKLREEYKLYTSLEKPTILENYFKDFIKQEIDTRGIGV